VSELLAHLRRHAEDRESWLVHADELTARGDARGELLVLEDRGVRAWEGADDWMTSVDLGEDALEDYLWIRRLSPLVDAPVATFARPISQLLALVDVETRDTEIFAQHRADIIVAMRAWIDLAFDGVPPPDEDHSTLRQAEAADNYDYTADRSQDFLGRWQDLPVEELLACQWAIPHLDEQGMHYYLPAVMTVAVGQRYHENWITESCEYSLQPSKGNLRDYQRTRLRLLDRGQRAAIYAHTLVCSYAEAAAAWARVYQAERTGERVDWFELFSPPP
jgi:hypothetical protein